MKNSIKFDSFCVREVDDPRTTKPHILPIYATSSFAFENIGEGIEVFAGSREGHVYGRYGNPTIEAVAQKIAEMETFGLDREAFAILFSSGMSAISSLVLGILKKGDKILTQGNLYGGTTELLTKIFQPFGIETLFTDLSDPGTIENFVKKDKDIRLLFCETPANPTLACVDLEAIGLICKKYGLWSAVDNTFATPYLQQPFVFGIDFIVHSTTKFLNGHGNSIAGALVGADVDLMKTKIWTAMKLSGANCNPWDAWLVHNGMKTLALRMDRHSSNALQLSTFLEKHAKVARVNYCGLPGHPDHSVAKKQMRQFGAMMSFELKGGLEAGKRFMDEVRICVLAPTLGDVDTLILHPASMSHRNIDKELRLKNGITDGLIRVSVGIENIQDLINDMEQALQKI